jgi:hypothetical protein
MTNEWITDRQPMKEDEDWNGEVCMQRFPDGREASVCQRDALVAAAHVGPGVPWKRTDMWEPLATPEPEPEAPTPAPKPKLRVGQVWRTRDGLVVIIKTFNGGNTYPFGGSNGSEYTEGGRYWLKEEEHGADLVELITDPHARPAPQRMPIWPPSPAESPQPEPEPTTRKVPRLFAAPPVRTWAPDGMGLIDALATDGTAWHRHPRDPQWTQHPLLPDREEPIDSEPADGPQWGTVAG